MGRKKSALRHLKSVILMLLCCLSLGCVDTYTQIKEQRKAEYAALSRMVQSYETERQARREQYVKDHPKLSAEMKDGILNKKPVLGMNAEQVKLAFGSDPCEVTKTVNFNGNFELWRYDCLQDSASKYLTFSNNILVSWTE